MLLLLIACFYDPYSAREAIHDYEYFHTAFNRIEARVAQVEAHRSLLGAETDPDEQRRLRIELSGMEQSCRELIADYNANSDKVTNGVFMGWSLPDHVNPSKCEGVN